MAANFPFRHISTKDTNCRKIGSRLNATHSVIRGMGI